MMGASQSDHYGRSSIFASLMTFAQRTASAAITAASSAGELPTGFAPCDGLSAHYQKLMWQGKLPRGWRTAFVYRPHVHLWEDANVLDCDPRVEPEANASSHAPRPSIRQGLPVDWAAREGHRCRPIHDGAPALGSRCKKVRGRRGMDAGSALEPDPEKACPRLVPMGANLSNFSGVMPAKACPHESGERASSNP